MNHRYKPQKKQVSTCVLVALMLPILLISIGGTVYANFVMSTRLTCATTASSGSVAIEITGWSVVSTNTMDVNDNGVILGDELRVAEVTDGDGKTIGLNITVDPIFPDWLLNLTVDIHNTLDSIPVNLNRTFYYFNSSINDWMVTDQAGLLSLFRIEYFDAWYNATGHLIPDITTYDLWPCETVTTLESLTFDGQDYPELQGETFCFLVAITATYPENGG